MLQYIRNMPQTVRYQHKSAKKDKNQSSKNDSVDFDQISESQSSQIHSEDDDNVSTLSKKWGGQEEIGLRTAIFVSFLKLETFKHGKKVIGKQSVSSRMSISDAQPMNEGIQETPNYQVFDLDREKKRNSSNSDFTKKPALLNYSSSLIEIDQFDNEQRQENQKKHSLNEHPDDRMQNSN